MARRSVLILLTLCAGPAAAWAAAEGAAAPPMAHRMMLLAIQVGLILFAARLGSILFEKMRLPGVLGELGVGMLIGPYCLGRIPFYGFSHGLFPLYGEFPISPELYGLTALAAVVLLFSVGLETDLRMLLRYSLAGGLVGLGGIVFSFFFGAGALMLFSRAVLGQPVGLFAPPCLFMGLITTATSVGITARLLVEKRRLDSPEGVTILSAAVIDDVAGIILLAVVMGVVSASRATGQIDWAHIAQIAAKAIGVWLAATVVGLAASRRISFLLKWFGERTSIAVIALGLALVLAGLFEEAGLAMIIGAYVMGLSLSQADINHVVREKLEPIYALLVPLFFCVMGMRINFGELGNPSVLVFGALYALTAMAAKLLGCGLPALLANFNLRGAARIGFGMAPRCEVALIIAGIGLSAHLVTPAMFAAVILMVVINTVVAPPAMVFLFRGGAAGTRTPVDLSEQTRRELRFEFPSLQTAEFMMDKLAAVLGSEGFFVHQLGHEPRFYQLRKDRAVIDARCAGATLTFLCRPADVPLVNTAMYEAAAALEQTLRQLRKPRDTGAIAVRMQQQAQLDGAGLDMRRCLSPELIEPELRATTKHEVIEELLDMLDRAGLLADRQAAHRDVWAREESMSTGLQYGVAIPHARTDAASSLVAAVGIKREGIDFDAMDSEPSHIFILTLSPKDRPAPQVQFLSTIGQVLNADGRARILACRTRREIYEALTTKAKAAAPRRPRPAPPSRAPHFRLADFIRPERVQPRLAGQTVEEIIHELVGLLNADGAVRSFDTACEAVLARERQMSTALGEGVAIPHGRTDAVGNLACAVGIKPEGIDFGALDGEPSRIFVLILTPSGGSDPYLQLVASVVNALDAAGREELLRAQTREEVCRLLAGAADA